VTWLCHRLTTAGRRAFPCAGPLVRLQCMEQSSCTLHLDSFKRCLKCFMFATYWHSTWSTLEIFNDSALYKCSLNNNNNNNEISSWSTNQELYKAWLLLKWGLCMCCSCRRRRRTWTMTVCLNSCDRKAYGGSTTSVSYCDWVCICRVCAEPGKHCKVLEFKLETFKVLKNLEVCKSLEKSLLS